jgi:toxin ParE1/3/4
MKLRVVVRPAADRDVEHHARYLAEHASIDTALTFYERLEETYTLLATFPEMGKLAEFAEPIQETRVFPAKDFQNYLIFYIPIRGGIDVLRVVHGSQDLRQIFQL